MENFYSFSHRVRTKAFTALCTSIFLLSLNATQAQSQNRNFGIVFSENMKGSSALFGNTLMYYANPDGSVNLDAMNGNSANGTNSQYDNGGFNTTNMQYVDVDGN